MAVVQPEKRKPRPLKYDTKYDTNFREWLKIRVLRAKSESSNLSFSAKDVKSGKLRKYLDLPDFSLCVKGLGHIENASVKIPNQTNMAETRHIFPITYDTKYDTKQRESSFSHYIFHVFIH